MTATERKQERHMSTTTTPEIGSDLTTLPKASAGGPIPGLYVCELESVKAAGKSKYPNPAGEYDDQAEVVWTIRKVLDTEADDPQELVGTKIIRYPALKMSKRANLRKWFEAHAKRELELGEEADISEILHTLAKVHVAQEQGQNGIETHITVTSYEPPKKTGAKSKPAPVPQPADDEDEDELDF